MKSIISFILLFSMVSFCSAKNTIEIKLSNVSLKEQSTKPDTITIKLKNGLEYRGIIKEKDEKGILFITKSGRAIYINKKDILSSNEEQSRRSESNSQYNESKPERSVLVKYRRTLRENRITKKDTIPIIIELNDGQVFTGKKTVGSSKGKWLMLNDGRSVFLKERDITKIARGEALEYDSSSSEKENNSKLKTTKSKRTFEEVVIYVVGGVLASAVVLFSVFDSGSILWLLFI